MPLAPLKPCSRVGCRELTRAIYCLTHEKDQQQSYDKERGSAASRGYDSKWRKARIRFLRNHPLCVECENENELAAATVVDHIIPHKGDKVLFWDCNNWQPLCKPHHDSKTAKENGGFGNERSYQA